MSERDKGADEDSQEIITGIQQGEDWAEIIDVTQQIHSNGTESLHVEAVSTDPNLGDILVSQFEGEVACQSVEPIDDRSASTFALSSKRWSSPWNPPGPKKNWGSPPDPSLN